MNTPLFSIALLTSVATLAYSAMSTQDAPAAPLEFPAASPAGTLEQRVGVTDIKITYARPSMRGRTVFGGLVPFGEVWRTGANGATTITFSTDVTFGGKDVPAGTYGLFTIPGQDEWTVILNAGAQQWGSYAYDESKDTARIAVAPTKLAQPVETLTIGTSNLSSGTATIHLDWANTRVAIDLDTNIVKALMPQIEAAMAGEGEKPYLSAAMFYFENGLDLKKAAMWIDEGAKAQPDAFWITYRKGLILEKLGDKKGAMEAAKQSLDMASKAKGEIKDEYTRLNEALIARLK